MAAPTRVWQRLAAAPAGPRRVIHAGRSALYVALDDAPTGCVGLVSATATRVPCALWSTRSDLDRLNGLPVRVDRGTLVVGDEAVRITRVVDVRLPAPAEPQPWRGPARFSDLPALPADGHLTGADVEALLGRGPGLTPLGDDVLAGWLAVRVAAGARDPAVEDAVRRSLDATTSLSATLLDCALHGEALPQLAAWLTAGDAATGESAQADLLRVGATSGAGLLAGATLALRSLEDLIADLHTDHPGRVA